MRPTILLVGATGNTGRSAVRTLSELLPTSPTLSSHRILALTRSPDSPAARSLAGLPGVEVASENWPDISASWLRERNVVRVFIASHNQPSQFAEESHFLLAALRAGVHYVVRISTTAANVAPDCAAYYPRTHWAIEAMLGSAEFSAMQWTSLQPNVFSTFILSPAAELIGRYRKREAQGTLRLMIDADAPVGIIHPDDVGTFAAHLLASEDTAVHNKAKYVLNGPEDINGAQIVKMIEQYIGTGVDEVSFGDVSFIDDMAAQAKYSKSVILSIKHAPETAWEGKCSTSTTSKEVIRLAAPKRAPADVLQELLGE